jgi:hypothetical protein
VEDWLRTGARYGRRARANAKVWIKIKVKVEVERSTNIVVFRGRLLKAKSSDIKSYAGHGVAVGAQAARIPHLHLLHSKEET